MLASRSFVTFSAVLLVGASFSAQAVLAERKPTELVADDAEVLDTRRRTERRSAQATRRRAQRRERRRARRAAAGEHEPLSLGSASRDGPPPAHGAAPTSHTASLGPRALGAQPLQGAVAGPTVEAHESARPACDGDAACGRDAVCKHGRCVEVAQRQPQAADDERLRQAPSTAAHAPRQSAHDHPRAFVEVAVGVGITSLSRGRAPDRLPPSSEVERAALRATDEESGRVDTAEVERELRKEGWDCQASAADERIEAENCAVAVDPGLATDPIFEAAVGYHLLPRFALALTALVQRNYGVGPMAGILAGLRGEYLLVPEHRHGVQVGALAGFGVGALQAHARGAHHDRPRATNAQPGRIGASISLGLKAAYRVHRHLAFGITPLFNIGLPNILFDIGLTGGVEVAF